MTGKVKYVESWLEGKIWCSDGTLVVFTRPEEDEDGARVPARPKPTPPTQSASASAQE